MADHLTEAQVALLRDHISREQARTVARAESLQRQFDDIVTASADAVRDDEHDPEGATIAFERAQVAALLADTATRLEELDRATRRLQQRDGDACDRCGSPIGYERLVARPGTTRCVACAG